MLRAAFPRSQGETTEFEALPRESIFRRPALRAVNYVGYFNRMFQHSVDDYEPGVKAGGVRACPPHGLLFPD
jgi:hypothetical protein